MVRPVAAAAALGPTGTARVRRHARRVRPAKGLPPAPDLRLAALRATATAYRPATRDQMAPAVRVPPPTRTVLVTDMTWIPTSRDREYDRCFWTVSSRTS